MHCAGSKSTGTRFGRQGHAEGCPLPDRAVDLDQATVGLDDAPRDAEAQPGAALRPAASAVNPVKAAEDERLVPREIPAPLRQAWETDVLSAVCCCPLSPGLPKRT